MMKRAVPIPGKAPLLWAGAALSAGLLATLGNYARREILRRGYPSWEACHCDFKLQPTVFQVWHSQHEQRGETIFAQEWGLNLPNLPYGVRRLLHHGAQVLATLNPRGGYIERVTLGPREARQLAVLLRISSGEELHTASEELPQTSSPVVWRREVLHIPRRYFDSYIRRLYPVQLAPERTAAAESLPAVWDPQSNLPLPCEGSLLITPVGTRIDCIGWTPAQVSYCTARLRTA